jgi:hypothetical protein
MANKTTFTPEEWAILRDTPQLAAMAVTVSGASGLFGTIQEAFGTTSALVGGMQSDNELIRALCAKDEIVAAQQTLKGQAKEVQGAGGDLEALKAKLQASATENISKAIALLSRKGDTADLAAYRTFVSGLADKVANAAKEGSFLGFGGERVSGNERQMIAQIESALGARA